MFDVLDCYILYMCLLPFIYYTLYNCFGGSPAGEADKIGFFFKKNPYVHRFPDKHKGHMGADVASGLERAYVAYVRQPGGTNEHKSLRFVGSA
jgi:hypothetical protein